MTDHLVRCAACEHEQDATTSELARVPCNIREFRHETFTVWRCGQCRSLHTLEAFDADRYYANYPIGRQKMAPLVRKMFAARLAQLERGGLRRTHRILDYGCGNGVFVDYLESEGYTADGFDPYAVGENVRSLESLQSNYDFVICQDVIEHVAEPAALIKTLIGLLEPHSGLLAIGTPDADMLSLEDPLDAVGRLHQPYHQHILSRQGLVRLLELEGCQVQSLDRHWYADTRVPFINSQFVFRYASATGGVLDADGPVPRLLLPLLRPAVLWSALFGGFSDPQKDVLVFASYRPAH